MLLIFSLTIFINSFLLFLIQPMFARMILPILGGAPAVWNTALVFYQAVLLGGYAYAHASAKWLGGRLQVVVHLGLILLVFITLPTRLPVVLEPPLEQNPAPWLLALMTLSIGLPFFVVSAGSPLLQQWFSSTGHSRSGDPYFLYAASNLGSILALLSYPLVLEPTFRLPQQCVLWAIGYSALAVMMSMCALLSWRSKRTGKEVPDRRSESNAHSRQRWFIGCNGNKSRSNPLEGKGKPAIRLQLRWVILSFVPASLMVSVTTFLTTDIAAVPLLWVIPLAIYLLTFILAFSVSPFLQHRWVLKAIPIVLLPLVVVMATRAADPIALLIPMHLLVFLLIALACHRELFLCRPPATELTRFYLLLSTGGVLGGAFTALLAPLIFSGIAEYPVVLILACLLLPGKKAEPMLSRARVLDIILPLCVGLTTVLLIARLQNVNSASSLQRVALMFGLPAIVSFSFSRRPLRFALSVGAIFLAANSYSGNRGKVLFAERSFFGISRVTLDDSEQYHQILHGSTLHGRQWINPARRREPVAYYHREGPLGQIFKHFEETGTLRKVAAVGLGAGGITAYAKAGQEWAYYEIDPLVERIARDTRFFTYLKDCPADLKVIPGDGRLSIAKAQAAQFDLVILDAYSSDALPVHLFTREALQLYLHNLAPGGVLAFHISNRYLDIEPVLGNLAQDAGLFSLARSDTAVSIEQEAAGKTASKFLVMARNKADLGSLSSDTRWRKTRIQAELPVWTDDYSSIIKILRWHR